MCINILIHFIQLKIIQFDTWIWSMFYTYSNKYWCWIKMPYFDIYKIYNLNKKRYSIFCSQSLPIHSIQNKYWLLDPFRLLFGSPFKFGGKSAMFENTWEKNTPRCTWTVPCLFQCQTRCVWSCRTLTTLRCRTANAFIPFRTGYGKCRFTPKLSPWWLLHIHVRDVRGTFRPESPF